MYRIAIWLTAIILLATPDGSWGAEFRPLSEIMQEATPEVAVYGLMRCSALHYASSGKFLNSRQKERGKNFSATAEKTANQFNLAANLHAKRLGFPMSQEKILEHIESIMDAYSEKWKSNYALTGNDWAEMTYEDLKTCSEIAASLSN